jgi:hypothetical protein
MDKTKIQLADAQIARLLEEMGALGNTILSEIGDLNALPDDELDELLDIVETPSHARFAICRVLVRRQSEAKKPGD